MSYTLDIYRGKMGPWRSFLDFALFVTFFPQLVAGPIVRAADFLPQCETPRKGSPRQLGWGLSLIVGGLFQKIILADTLLAPVGDKVFGAPDKAGLWDAWTGVFAFSGQIFFDFSGYSTCAIGAALCLGFALTDNFRFPYGAVGFSDFWRRWHISLSSWLKDYLYISLGGNRRGQARTFANIMLTMLIGGLWHGASWCFVVWGGLHGIYLAAERMLRSVFSGFDFLKRSGALFCYALLTYFFVGVTYVFFRAVDFTSAFSLLAAMAGGGSENLVTPAEVLTVLGINAALVLTHFALRKSSVEEIAGKMPWGLRAAIITGLLLCLALVPGDDRAFIYFQF